MDHRSGNAILPGFSSGKAMGCAIMGVQQEAPGIQTPDRATAGCAQSQKFIGRLECD